MYSLEIFSKSGNGKKLFQKHAINGSSVIGVDRGEAFGIRFKNNTGKLVQVKLSVDGTDVLTGETANTRTSGKMFVVRPYNFFELDAWPEDNEKGRAFIFNTTEVSVAMNTHGNARGVGIIAAAVFEEGEVPKYVPRMDFIGNCVADVTKGVQNIGDSFRRVRQREDVNYISEHTTLGFVPTSSTVSSSTIPVSATADADSFVGASVASFDYERSDTYKSRSLSASSVPYSAPAVGAGDYVNQKISTASVGLVRAKLATVVEVKYDWYSNIEKKTQTAFPGDEVQVFNKKLGSVPNSSMLYKYGA
jgi:hypothetical protein